MLRQSEVLTHIALSMSFSCISPSFLASSRRPLTANAALAWDELSWMMARDREDSTAALKEDDHRVVMREPLNIYSSSPFIVSSGKKSFASIHTLNYMTFTEKVDMEQADLVEWFVHCVMKHLFRSLLQQICLFFNDLRFPWKTKLCFQSFVFLKRKTLLITDARRWKVMT